MFEEQVSIKVRQETRDKTWGVTEQFLQVHDIVLVDGQPKIERVDMDKEDGKIVAYIPVKEESFFFTVYFDNKESLNITGIGTEPYNSVCFRASSNNLNLEELKSMTTLSITNGWTKGDKKKYGKDFHDFSSLEIEPNPEPDEFEDKLKKLLNYLEKDSEGIKRLTDITDAHIQVAMKFHNGNKCSVDRTSTKK